jgi:endonuclease/exonuclease/phosphatase family metal-dependent hydrolase
VIALQETSWGVEPLAGHFAGWHTVHVGEFWVSSRHPVRVIDECTPKAFERTTAILCEIEAPQGTILVCNVHLSTARHGLTDLRWHSPFSGAGVDDLEWRQWQRRLEAEETVRFIAEHAQRPLIIVGDFNTPANSTLLTDVWNGYTNAFDAAGWGYGYTSPCNTGRLWPANTPWLRIDHILCDDAWQVHRCAIGKSAGSDHRLIYAWLSLR